MEAKKMKYEEKDQCLKEGLHDSHSFAFITGKAGSPREITCPIAQTAYEALLTSSSFSYKNNAKKVKEKELVILLDKKAISTHFPCWLIEKDSLLIIEYIKADENSEPPKSVSGSPQLTAVVFHVKTEGDKNIKNNILNNKNLKDIADEVSVYAFEGETVEEALKRDGRFKSAVFSKCSLKNISNDRITEMSFLVDNLDGKTFKLKRDDKYAPLKSQSIQPVPCTSNGTSTSSPLQPATVVPVNPDMAEQTARQNTSTRAKPFPIPYSNDMIDLLLRAQFPGLVERMMGRKGRISNAERLELFRVEYGKNDETCNSVKMMKRLMDPLADSVCQVRVEGVPKGSGFLLFDKFILTCAHFIKGFYDDDRKQLTHKVTVSFRFLDLESAVDSVAVKPEVVVFNFTLYDSGFYYDWALLELDSALTKNIPSGLLSNFATQPQRGGTGICIIGHPDNGVKKIDTCLTITGDDSEKVVDDRFKGVQQLITKHYFGPFEESRLKNQRTDLAYDTCFFYGSSGAPVFDEFCNVVAMHTGGYVYEKAGKVQKESFIEYAQPLSRILPKIIIQIVERQRFDVLKAYLQYTSDHPKAIWDQVKEEVGIIVTMQNNTVYKVNMANYEQQNIREVESMETDEFEAVETEDTC